MDEEQEHKLRLLARLIAESPHNLVSRAERERVYEAHVLECAAYLPHLPLERGQRWLDLGTGGGLPGLVLAVLRPDVQWTLVDSVRKKTDAVATFAQAMNLMNITVISGRAEELAREPAFRAQYQGVIARAVAELRVLLELMRGFVGDQGIVVAIKGPRWQDEVAAARSAASALQLEESAVVPIPSAPRAAWLVMMHANGQPPEDYPRRTGTPQARPLGGS